MLAALTVTAPCIEQVQKTVGTLREHAWQEIECFELATREWESRYMERKDIKEAVGRLQGMKRRRVEGQPKPEAPKRLKEGQEGADWDEVARPETQVKGHTSFLVFALKFAH